MTDALMERLAASGHAEVRAAHGAVFEYLDDAGTRVSVLAERARMTKQSMTELVAHLERHGYVERVPDPADGRARLVRLTSRALEVIPFARAEEDRIEAEWTEYLGAARMAGVRDALEALREVTDPYR
jgi:DNA-binding MarR family transcriptional regulator